MQHDDRHVQGQTRVEDLWGAARDRGADEKHRREDADDGADGLDLAAQLGGRRVERHAQEYRQQNHLIRGCQGRIGGR